MVLIIVVGCFGCFGCFGGLLLFFRLLVALWCVYGLMLILLFAGCGYMVFIMVIWCVCMLWGVMVFEVQY